MVTEKINLMNCSIEDIVELLPHGSGFNGEWDAKIEDNTFVGNTIYEHMNENGMYDFDAPFMVKIPLEDAVNFEIKLTGTEEQNRLAEDDDLITYFEDIIAESLLDY